MRTNPHDPPASVVQADWTLFRILLALKELDGAGTSEIAEEVGLAKSTVHDHLRTLVAGEFVVQQDGEYALGLRFLDLGESARRRQEGHDMIRRKVDRVAKETDERAQFIVEEHGVGVFLYRSIVGSQAVQADSRLGKRLPLNTSSAGKSILAHSSAERVEKIVEEVGLPAETDNSVTGVEELHTELETIRQRGYAVARDEATIGLSAVGAPVLDHDGVVVGALSVSGPSHRLHGDWFEEELPNIVLGAANEIELNLEFG